MSGQPASDAHAARKRPALIGPALDSLTLAWAWLPFYLFVVFALGIDGDWSSGGRDGNGTEPGLGLATLLALGVSYVHRHYTFLLVYGDAEVFSRRARAYTITPALLFIGLALVLRLGGDLRIPLGERSIHPWMIVLGITGAWNMWHTLMQRYGIARAYAGRVGAGLETRAHGRRDLALLWSGAALTAVVTLLFRAQTFGGIGNARKVLAAAAPILDGPVGWGALIVAASVFAQIAFGWIKHERAADLSWRERFPRLNFVASTAALLLVFVAHGPIVGYLCFGVAHALEYIVFFHVFGHAKYARQARDSRSFAGSVLARPAISGPAIAIALTALFFVLADYRKTEAYMAYYTATSLLHFLYDGWIWKRPKPKQPD